jgi:hypothetical protein
MEFIQIAYCCTVPFLLLMIVWKNRYRFFCRNLMAVSLFLLIGHSVFLMRQLSALYQLSKQWQLQASSVSPVAGSTLIRMLLVIVLPFLSLLPGFRKSVVLGVVMLVLLYLNDPPYTWNSFDLFNKIPVYVSLVSATYGLFWLLNLLPYQTRNT